MPVVGRTCVPVVGLTVVPVEGRTVVAGLVVGLCTVVLGFLVTEEPVVGLATEGVDFIGVPVEGRTVDDERDAEDERDTEDGDEERDTDDDDDERDTDEEPDDLVTCLFDEEDD